MDWQAFLAGVGLFFVLEGLLPFISPEKYKTALQAMQQLASGQVRTFGGICVIIGLAILYLR